MVNFILAHQVIFSVAGTWLFNNVVTVMISSMPAPGKDSTQNYVYWFKVLNTFIGNLQRAQASHIESSPNWQAAVEAHVEKMAQSGTLPENKQ